MKHLFLIISLVIFVGAWAKGANCPNLSGSYNAFPDFPSEPDDILTLNQRGCSEVIMTIPWIYHPENPNDHSFVLPVDGKLNLLSYNLEYCSRFSYNGDVLVQELHHSVNALTCEPAISHYRYYNLDGKGNLINKTCGSGTCTTEVMPRTK